MMSLLNDRTSLLILAVVLFTSFFDRSKFNGKSAQLFKLLVSVAMIYVIIDGCCNMLALNPGSDFLTYLVNRMSFVFDGVLYFFSFEYVISAIEERTYVHKAFKILACVFTAISVIIFLIPPVAENIYEINTDGMVEYGPLLPLLYIVYLFEIALVVVMSMRYRKSIGALETVIFIVFFAMPTLVYFLDTQQSSMFGLLTAIGVLMLYISVYQAVEKEYANQQQEIAEKNAKLATTQSELTDMRMSIMLSQIKPHFLYNTLSSIVILCDKDSAKAKATAANFTRYLRGNMDSLSEQYPITFDKELGHTCAYLEIEKVRFGDRLNVELDIRTTDFLLPSLTLEPIVENAVKHGVCQKIGGGTVKISTYETENEIVVSVEDDGPGFDIMQVKTEDVSHIGINNVRYRLKKMSNGELEIQSTEGVGTTAVIRLPKGGKI